ncbi:unnamed protein product [Symbiodinium sp. CCMP2456]|nr:unnamed protein product [Symbiodinium sp. CCMP2456]
MLHSWARANGHELAMDEFSFSDDYPSLNAKGWDIKLVCMWLAEITPAFARSAAAARRREHAYVMSMTARALAVTIEILDASIYAISRENAVRGQRACKRFILGYSWLAYDSYLEQKRLYKLRPKRLKSQERSM